MTIFDDVYVNMFTRSLLIPGGEMSIDNITLESIIKITNNKKDNILIILKSLSNALKEYNSTNGQYIYQELLNIYKGY